MGSRDHSIECETCGLGRGGLNDLRCDCDDPHAALLLATMLAEVEMCEALDTLAANLAIGAALCRAYEIGWSPQMPGRSTVGVSIDIWRPGCQRPAP